MFPIRWWWLACREWDDEDEADRGFSKRLDARSEEKNNETDIRSIKRLQTKFEQAGAEPGKAQFIERGNLIQLIFAALHS